MRVMRILGALAFFVGISCHALIVKLSDLHTMAKRSDVVVHGFVGEQRVVDDEMGRFVTLTDVEVIDGLHGAKTGEVITIYQVGGQKRGMVMPLLGGQTYIVGQEIYFFGLKLDNTYVSYGAGQGKFDVIHQSGEDLVVEDLGNVGAIVNGMGARVVSRPSPLVYSDAALFKEELKLMLKTP